MQQKQMQMQKQVQQKNVYGSETEGLSGLKSPELNSPELKSHSLHSPLSSLTSRQALTTSPFHNSSSMLQGSGIANSQGSNTSSVDFNGIWGHKNYLSENSTNTTNSYYNTNNATTNNNSEYFYKTDPMKKDDSQMNINMNMNMNFDQNIYDEMLTEFNLDIDNSETCPSGTDEIRSVGINGATHEVSDESGVSTASSSTDTSRANSPTPITSRI